MSFELGDEVSDAQERPDAPREANDAPKPAETEEPVADEEANPFRVKRLGYERDTSGDLSGGS